MTRLRDDGYLETDDPVVTACFLNRKVRQCLRKGFIKLLGVYSEFWDACGVMTPYPLLIPAATVAEVWEAGDVFVNQVLGAIGMYEHPTYTLGDWLRAHIGE